MDSKKEPEQRDELRIVIADLLNHEIRVRDRDEFELKLEFLADESLVENVYAQEFYFFIPGALQINRRTYKKAHFYRDVTSLVRFKTPSMSIDQLLDPERRRSPYNQVLRLLAADDSDSDLLIEELKLTANVIRSYVRNVAGKVLRELNKPNSDWERIQRKTEGLLREIAALRKALAMTKREMHQSDHWKPLVYHLEYVDEFVSLITENHLTYLLKELQASEEESARVLVEAVKACILNEVEHREQEAYTSKYYKDPEKKTEYRIYRRGLLKKYVMSVLQLRVQRHQVLERYTHLVGAVAAGLAMLFYLVLLVWWGEGFLFNSMPFILLSVVLYILKDRLKELVKMEFFKQASKWFPDYSIDIRVEDEEPQVGTLTEYWTFLPKRRLPEMIRKRRNRDFHTELEKAKRVEKVFYYRRELTLFSEHLARRMRRFHINNLLRFNLQTFTRKASSAYQDGIQLNPETGELEEVRCPKVYHVNVVMKTLYREKKGEQKTNLKEFRIVLDKNGIKRIETVR